MSGSSARRMAMNGLADALSGGGSSVYLTDDITVLGIPMATDDEVRFQGVRKAMEPKLEDLFLEEGYVVLDWVHAG
jgi:hypothetical protein